MNVITAYIYYIRSWLGGMAFPVNNWPLERPCHVESDC